MGISTKPRADMKTLDLREMINLFFQGCPNQTICASLGTGSLRKKLGSRFEKKQASIYRRLHRV